MRKNSILIGFVLILLLGCKNRDANKFYSYIESKCTFEKSDTSYIDLKDYFKIDYDTMYVFGEFTRIEGIKQILGKQDYENYNILMPKGFLVRDSYNKIILLNNNQIVLDKDMRTPYLYNDGIEITRKGVFDGEPYTHRAKIFTTSKFMIIKKYSADEPYYIYRNVLNDGSLVPYETIK